MIQVETVDGIELYLSADNILMVGAVIEEGIPVLGRARIMLLGGIGLMVKSDPRTISERIGVIR